jgi:hypothetical protein
VVGDGMCICVYVNLVDPVIWCFYYYNNNNNYYYYYYYYCCAVLIFTASLCDIYLIVCMNICHI